jgi:hypothetical protein
MHAHNMTTLLAATVEVDELFKTTRLAADRWRTFALQ